VVNMGDNAKIPNMFHFYFLFLFCKQSANISKLLVVNCG
jgi:hypothetical protein